MIGLRIKQLSEKHGLTQKDLADFLGVTPKAISFYELGQRELSNNMLLVLSNKFGVSTDYLLGKEQSQDTADLKEILMNTEVMFDGQEYPLTDTQRNIIGNVIKTVLDENKKS